MARPGALPLLTPAQGTSSRPAGEAVVSEDGLYVDRIGKSFGTRAVVKSVSLRLGRGEVAGLLDLTGPARPPVST
jgi:hypothetical protein